MPCSSHHRQRANTARSRGCRCGRSQDAGSFAPCKVALVPKLLGNCRRGTVWGLSESRICLHVHVWAHRKTAQEDPWSPDREISDKAPCNPPGFTAGLWDPAACFSSREELSESGHPYFHPRPALWSPLNHFFLYFISCTRHSRDTRLPFSSDKHRAPSRKPNLGGTAIAASFTNAVLRQTIVKGKNQCKNTKQSENAKSLSVPQSHITSQPKAGRSRDASSQANSSAGSSESSVCSWLSDHRLPQLCTLRTCRPRTDPAGKLRKALYCLQMSGARKVCQASKWEPDTVKSNCTQGSRRRHGRAWSLTR